MIPFLFIYVHPQKYNQASSGNAVFNLRACSVNPYTHGLDGIGKGCEEV
jgi:hypothetical protein